MEGLITQALSQGVLPSMDSCDAFSGDSLLAKRGTVARVACLSEDAATFLARWDIPAGGYIINRD